MAQSELGTYTTVSFFWPAIEMIVTLGVVAVVVLVVSAALANRNGAGKSTVPLALFLFGLSLVTLVVALSTTGIAVHALTQLVGPTPQSFSAPDFPPCSALPSTNTISTPSTDLSGNGAGGFPMGAGIPCVDSSGAVTINGSSLPSQPVGFVSLYDSDNHYISAAVATGLFAVAGLAGYAWAWRRARRLTDEVGLGEVPVGRLPLSYAYLLAGLAALTLVVVVPLAADNVFRAVAPGVNETSGHADGIRNLITFLVVGGLSALVLAYHLRYASSLRADGQPPTDQPELVTE